MIRNKGWNKELGKAWVVLEESLAMINGDLLMEYLEEGGLEDDKVIGGLCSTIIENKILPVVYTSAIQDQGVSELMAWRNCLTVFLTHP